MVEGGTAHGWERSTDQLVSRGAPLPSYIKEGRRRGPAKGEARPRGGNPTPSRFGPPFSYSKKEKGKEDVERRKERGAAAPFPCPIRTGARAAARHHLAALSFLH